MAPIAVPPGAGSHIEFEPAPGHLVTLWRLERTWRVELHTGTGPVRQLDDELSRSFAGEVDAREYARDLCLMIRALRRVVEAL